LLALGSYRCGEIEAEYLVPAESGTPQREDAGFTIPYLFKAKKSLTWPEKENRYLNKIHCIEKYI